MRGTSTSASTSRGGVVGGACRGLACRGEGALTGSTFFLPGRIALYSLEKQ